MYNAILFHKVLYTVLNIIIINSFHMLLHRVVEYQKLWLYYDPLKNNAAMTLVTNDNGNRCIYMTLCDS